MCYICIYAKNTLHMGKIKEIKIGDKFNSLIVLDNLGLITNGTKTLRNYFKCKCECSNIIICSGTDLRTNRKKHCTDCAWKKRSLKSKLVPQLQQMYNHDIILRCKHGNVNNNLSFEDFEKLVKLNCHYCNEKPSLVSKFKRNKYINMQDLYTNGIDRINSNKGYSKNNCVPCCSTCNKMKMNMNYKEFLNKISLIFKNCQLSVL